MKTLLICLGILSSTIGFTQNTFRAKIQDKESNEPLLGATALLRGTSYGSSADLDGNLIIENIPNGEYIIDFNYVGYESESETFTFPLESNTPVIIFLEGGEEFEVVIVSATRTSRSIEDIPTRMEAITSEELVEKSLMNSTNISMLLRESTGIQMQQTSANSANQSIRIQGLDGRYTQLLKDGFPLYSGFSGGLSVMQIPPLDLHQVEIIKGSASTLYGGGAIAGIINLVTKRPVEDKPELNLMLNQTSVNGTTGNLFLSKRLKKTGFTFYTSAHNHEPYDPNNDDFSDIPKIQSLTISPKFFLYPSEKTTIWLGINSTIENRIGGDMNVLKGNEDSLHTFSEENNTNRLSSQLHFENALSENQLLIFRNSLNYFNRDIELPAYAFSGKQYSSFSELSYSNDGDKTEWVFGANLYTDEFIEDTIKSKELPRSYNLVTFGGFAQNNWKMNKHLALESGFRLDYNTEYGVFPLPRISLLYKPNNKFSSRIGGGLGYKIPTIFTEDAERISYNNISPINTNTMSPEYSTGLNLDFNYRTVLGNDFAFSINQLFFYTDLRNSLVLETNNITGFFEYANANGPIRSQGFETNVKFSKDDFKLYLQYAFMDVTLLYDNINSQKPLTPRNNAGAIFMYEKEEKWRIGYEIYYTGQQFRSDYSETPDYTIMGFMVMRRFKHVSLYINFENFTDTRQSRYQSMVEPPHSNPTFTEIWAPTDGYVGSIGIILNFYSNQEE